MTAVSAGAELTSYSAPAVQARTIDHLRTHVNGVLKRKCVQPFRVRVRALKIAPKYRRWVLMRWISRHRFAHRVHERCTSRWASVESSFHSALRLASSTFGVSYGWLHSCDHSEGSDRFVYNRGGSGAYGPMQFMSGTFYSNVGAAFAYARMRGVAVPSQYARWDSDIGQAFTAAWMFKIGQSGQWTGAGC